MNKMRRFYFTIPSANVFECIWAHSFTEAKAKAAVSWLPWWNELQWLNPIADPNSQTMLNSLNDTTRNA